MIDVEFIDSIISILQMVLLFGSCGWYALRTRNTKHSPALSFLLLGQLGLALGDLYYLLHILLRGSVTLYVSSADISWIGCYYSFVAAHFLLELPVQKTPWYAWAMAGVTALDFVVVVIWYGEPILNFFWSIPMIWLAWCAGVGLHCTKKGQPRAEMHPYYIALTLFLLSELLLYLSSDVAYLVMDTAMTISALALAPTFYKGVADSSCTRKVSSSV